MRRLLHTALLTLCLTVGFASPHAVRAQTSADADRSLEYGVKAAFLLNFIRFTTWPTGQIPTDRVEVCVVGNNPFGDQLDRVLKGRREGGRILASRNAKPTDDLSSCQIVYLPDSPASASVLASLRGKPVLTVGEQADFHNAGGVIRLYVEQDKVRFTIHNGIAQRAGLQLSSRMLSVAAGVQS